MSKRSRSGVAGVVLVVLALVVGLVVVNALRADGRERSRTETNDGGAWLVRQRSGDVAHINFRAREQTVQLSAAEPETSFDVEQAPGIEVVFDRSAGDLGLIDPVSESILDHTRVGSDVEVFAVPDGVIVAGTGSLQARRLSRQQLLDNEKVDDVEPFLSGSGEGTAAAVRPDGTAAFYDGGEQRVVFVDPDGGQDESPVIGDPDDIVSMSLVGDTAVLVDSTNDMFFVTRDSRFSRDGGALVGTTASDVPPPTSQTLVLQQSANSGDNVVVATPEGRLVSVPLDDADAQQTEIASIGGSDPVPPIVYGGCVFAVSTNSPRYIQQCGADEIESLDLPNMSANIRLKLVNGWIWINDLFTGNANLAEPRQPLTLLDDLGEVPDETPSEVVEGDAAQNADQQREVEDNNDPDAELREADQQDDGVNDPPVARDDNVGTRVDRPVQVNALLNDSDADGDVLTITQFELQSGDPGTQVDFTPGHDALMVTPPAGSLTPIQIGYTITDGHPGVSDSAVINLVIEPVDAPENRPPTVVTDILNTRLNQPASTNVLRNDVDPDGDSLTLIGVAPQEADGPTGTITFEPTGQVVFNPDPAADQELIVLDYIVQDEYGAQSTGTINVNVRLEESNSEPDARNDSLAATVGRAVTGQVLTNDSDPDDDPLFIATEPSLDQAPEGPDGAYGLSALDVTLTPDGEFSFVPPVAGTYLFTYAASDGEESNDATIRVDATDAPENRPPVPVRDNASIPAGRSGAVFPLQNDGDPDGDVVSLIDFTPTDDLDVEVIDGSQMLITPRADAPPVVTFRYRVSDGIVTEPVTGIVVVSVLGPTERNQAPVTKFDVVEARPGGTINVPVTANDFDPEGTALTVTATSAAGSGQTAIGADGQSIDVTVDPTARASFTATYDVTDADGGTSSATVRVRIVPADQDNRAPIARVDTGRARAGIALTLDVTANDNDPDGDTVYVESINTQPAKGRVELGDDDVITFLPSASASGPDQFTYTLVDANGARTVGTALLGIVPAASANRPPDAVDDEADIKIGSTGSVLDLMENDGDPDGDTATITAVTTAPIGQATIVDGGAAVAFEPPAGLAASTDVAFQYTIDDGRGGTDTATSIVHLVLDPEPAKPIAADDDAGPALAGQPVTVDVRANDLDPDGNPGALVVSSADPGVVANPDGTVTITAGTESARYTYTVTDPTGLADIGQISLVVAANLAPNVPEPIRVTTPFETPTAEIDIGARVVDPDGDQLTYVVADGTLGGRATMTRSAPGAGVVFEPDAGFVGDGSFSFIVDDGNAHRVAVPVTVTVEPPANQPPIAVNSTFDVRPDGAPTLVDLTALVTDPDEGETLTFSYQQTSGTVKLAQDASALTATADPSIVGQIATATYTVTDSAGNTASGDLTFNVLPVDAPPPAANNDTLTLNAGTSGVIPVLANDVDPFGKGLVIAGIDGGAIPPAPEAVGAHALPDGQVEILAGAAASGIWNFAYTVNDPAGRTATATITVTVVSIPDAPTNLAATATSHQATLTWAAPDANGSAITHYEIATAANPAVIIATSPGSSVTIDDLPNGVEVAFIVRAVNPIGTGPFSPQSNAVRPDIPPGRPAAPTVAFADGALVVSWTPPPNDGSAIQYYNLRIGGGASQTANIGNVTTYRWVGLTNGTNYTFSVQAVNLQGAGEFSSESTPEHPLRPPGPPINVNGTRGNQAIDVRWTAPDNGGDRIDRYEVQRDTDNATNVTATTGLTWSQLQNGTPYRFRARAYNRGGPGEWSQWSAAITPCGTPLTPVQPNAVRGDQSATITFQAPDNQGCAITGYTITASSGQSMAVGPGTNTATFGGLSNGTSYTFTVTATNDEGRSPASPPSNAVTPAGPPTATAITSAKPGVASVQLAWQPSNPNGSPITRYEVVINGGNTRNAGTATSYNATGLADSTDYSFRVRACNDVACGALSAPANARTPGKPNQPGLTLTAGNATIEATWTEPGANGSPIDRYEVNISPGGSRNSGDRRVVFDNLTNGQQYTVSVRACNAVGCGPAAERRATPEAPTRVTIAKGDRAPAPDCTYHGGGRCIYVALTATGLVAGRTYTVACHDTSVFKTTSITASSEGRISTPTLCYYGFDANVFVTVGEYKSNVVAW